MHPERPCEPALDHDVLVGDAPLSLDALVRVDDRPLDAEVAAVAEAIAHGPLGQWRKGGRQRLE